MGAERDDGRPKERGARPPEFYQVQVQADVLDLLPLDVASVLDVGCGNGYVTNALPGHLHVVGLDIDAEALRHVRHPTRQASAADLPFGDGAFDLVMANDVIEHLPDEDHARALRQMARVAARHVLITVPHAEDLAASFTKCAECGTVYHRNRHQRGYTEESLLALFPRDFQPVEIRWSGDVTRPPFDPTMGVRHEMGWFQTWPDGVCPACGSNRQAESSEPSRTLRILDAHRSLHWADLLRCGGPWNNHSEVMVLYSRQPGRSRPSADRSGTGSESLLHVDFGNYLQEARPDFTPGAGWARFTRPASARQSAEGLCRAADAPDSLAVQIRLPVWPAAGDRIVLEASGTGDADAVALYATDGIACTQETLLMAFVTGRRRQLEVAIKRPWWPDRFGLALEMHLRGSVCVHRLRYEPADGPGAATAAFVALEAGLNVLRDDSARSPEATRRGEPARCWSLLAPVPAMFPQPRLGRRGTQGELERPMPTMVRGTGGLSAEAAPPPRPPREGSDRPSAESSRPKAGSDTSPAGLRARAGARAVARTGLRYARRLVGGLRAVPAPPAEPVAPWEPCRPAAPSQADLKVLVLSHMFPQPDQPLSGPFIHEQALALRRHAGADARVLSGRPFRMGLARPLGLWKHNRFYKHLHDTSRWWALEGVPVKYLPYRIMVPFWGHGASYRSSMLRGIEKLREAFPFDLVHAHTGYLDGGAGLAIARHFGVPLVITEHTGPFSRLMSNPIVRWWTLRALDSADRVIVVSEAQKRAVSAHLAKDRQDRVVVIPNGVDTDLFRPADRWAPDPNRPRILFVGFFATVKNMPLLLDAFTQVLREIPGARLTLVGRGEYPYQDEELQARIRGGLIGKVHMTGLQPRQSVARIMREHADMLVLSSDSETFGCVLVEAMASGLPVVATRCGGPEDIVTEPGLGELCPPRDAAALAAALCRAAGRLASYDPRAIRASALARFSYRSVAERLRRLYDGLRDPARGD